MLDMTPTSVGSVESSSTFVSFNDVPTVHVFNPTCPTQVEFRARRSSTQQSSYRPPPFRQILKRNSSFSSLEELESVRVLEEVATWLAAYATYFSPEAKKRTKEESDRMNTRHNRNARGDLDVTRHFRICAANKELDQVNHNRRDIDYFDLWLSRRHPLLIKFRC
jgi:hypothetical protein